MLCVCEKHSVAKQMALSLCDSPTKVQINKFSYAYQMVVNLQPNQSTEVVIIHGAGHAKEYEFKNQKLSDQEYFTTEIVSKSTSYASGLIAALKRYLPSTTTLFMCQDNDREGEHIAWETVELASDVRQINIYPAALPKVRLSNQLKICSEAQTKGLKTMRVRFSSLLKDDLIRALLVPEPLGTRIIEAVDVRFQLDLRIGFALSSIQRQNTKKLLEFQKTDVKQNKKPTFTFGTCQIPTLGLAVTKRCQNFTQQAVLTLHLVDGCKLEAATKPKLMAIEAAHHCCSQLKINSKVNLQIKAEKIVCNPPTAPNTLDLQRELPLPAEITMKTAESLYQRGIISYPRTETRCFGNYLKYDKIKSILSTTQGSYKIYVNKLVTTEGYQRHLEATIARVNQIKNIADDEAHPPIHPLKFIDLDGNDKTVFDAVARLFLASISYPAQKVIHEQSVKIEDETFRNSKTYIADPGYLEILRGQQKDVIPDIQLGATIDVDELAMRDVKHEEEVVNQKSLITKMEEHGIGTDATISEHIHHIQERGYVDKQMKIQAAGEVISNLYRRVNVMVLSTAFRSWMEAGLREITLGVKKPDYVYLEVLKEAQKLFQQVKSYLQ